MDHLFSSPEKSAKGKGVSGRGRNANGTISSEEDMDVDDSMRHRAANTTMDKRC